MAKAMLWEFLLRKTHLRTCKETRNQETNWSPDFCTLNMTLLERAHVEVDQLLEVLRFDNKGILEELALRP